VIRGNAYVTADQIGQLPATAALCGRRLGGNDAFVAN
jgi:hypothetical protein